MFNYVFLNLTHSLVIVGFIVPLVDVPMLNCLCAYGIGLVLVPLTGQNPYGKGCLLSVKHRNVNAHTMN